MLFGISAQNDAEWWSSCPKLIDFRRIFFDLKLGDKDRDFIVELAQLANCVELNFYP